jgi:hypothetical protein
MKRLIIATVISTLLLAGCAGQDDSENAAPAATPSAMEPAGSEVLPEAAQLLEEYGLGGKDTVEIIDHLDRLGGKDRPADLMASVRPGELVLSSGADEVSLTIPEDRFYLSVAPYVDQTHECFHHSLTTCTGELASTDVQVQIVDETNDRVLIDETRTTFENGFTGFWLPRDIKGSLRVTYDGKTGEADFATDQDAPTCLTTLRMA